MIHQMTNLFQSLFDLLNRRPGTDPAGKEHIDAWVSGGEDERRETWEEFHGPLSHIPRNRSEVYEMFGDPGTIGARNRKWERANCIVAKGLPGSWNDGAGRLYVHKKVEPYLREGLRRVEIVAPRHIHRLGCFNFRSSRHDSSRPLSYHCWAAAIDINPRQNRAINPRDPDDFPEPFSPEWYEIWPEGVPEELVRALESVGWTWGGHWKSFRDPMHFQLVG